MPVPATLVVDIGRGGDDESVRSDHLAAAAFTRPSRRRWRDDDDQHERFSSSDPHFTRSTPNFGSPTFEDDVPPAAAAACGGRVGFFDDEVDDSTPMASSASAAFGASVPSPAAVHPRQFVQQHVPARRDMTKDLFPPVDGTRRAKANEQQ